MFRRAAISAACAVTIVPMLLPVAAWAHTDLVLVNFGGTAARAQMLALLRPWEQESGKRAEMESYNGGLEDIRDQVEAANVTWDVIDMEYSDLIQACDEGLLEKIDPATLPDSPDGQPANKDFRSGALHECGVGNVVWSTVYAYDADQLQGTAPSTIADFFDLDNFPGRRGLRRDPRGLLEWALMADGVWRPMRSTRPWIPAPASTVPSMCLSPWARTSSGGRPDRNPHSCSKTPLSR